MRSPNPNDLSSLINQAADVAVAASARREIRGPTEKRSLGPWVLGLVLASVAIALIAELWTHHVPRSRARIAGDLATAVELARASVEEYRTRTGALPEVLPNASLAAVVYYAAKDNQYKLVASASGVEVTIDWDGSQSNSVGAKL